MQSALVGCMGVILAAAIPVAVTLYKKSDLPQVSGTTPPVIVTPTPFVQPTPSPTPNPTPSSTPRPLTSPTAQPPRSLITTAPKENENAELLAQIAQLKEQLKEKGQALETEKQLNHYIDQYIDQYSQVDLGDNPCDPSAIEKQRKAKALLDLIESLAQEAKRTDIVNNFVRERHPGSIRFGHCS